MGVKVFFSPQQIFFDYHKSAETSLEFITNEIITDTTSFVPLSPKRHKGHGTLRNSAHVVGQPRKLGVQIGYNRPVATKNGVYDVAGALYDGMNLFTGAPVQNWSTPRTGERWFQKSKDANLDKWVADFEEETRRIWRDRKRRQHKK